MKLAKVGWIEPLIFFVIVILNLSPIFCCEHFTTLDSGAHLYNANIVKTLLTENHSLYSDVYTFNSEPIPNWSGHFILAILLLFFKANLAEKILLCSIFILLPIFFRKIVKIIAPNNLLLSYAIFPFTHYCLLYLGFYNFTLGVLFFLIFLSFWLKNHENKFTWKQYLLLSSLFLTLYFSHLFAFIIGIMFIGLHIFITSIFNDQKTFWKSLFSKTTPVLITSAPFLLLTLNYFIKRPIKLASDFVYLKTDEIFNVLLNGEVFASNNYLEKPFSQPLATTLIVLFLLTFVRWLYFIFKEIKNKTQMRLIFLKPGVAFLFLAIFLFSCAFILPNDDGYGGFITLRFIYLSFMCMLIFACDQPGVSKIIQICFFLVSGTILFLHFNLIQCKQEGIRKLNSERYFLAPAFNLINKKSSVLSYNFMNRNNWILGHILEYAGAENGILVMNNYEASAGYFPVVYKKNPLVELKEAGGNSNINAGGKVVKEIDYILIYGEKDGQKEYEDLHHRISGGYQLIYATARVNLYCRKSMNKKG